jgi:biopolymer transport protein ExbD
MRLSSGYEDRRGRIEIVPLIDIIFLLLVFFIYAMVTMTVERGVRVRLPSAGGERGPGDRLTLTLTASNTLYLDTRPVTLTEALDEAEDAARRGIETVLIRGDREAGLGPSIELVSGLRARGVRTVSFSVQAPTP